ncbi:MAG: glycosyltransferase [Pseudomonadota bacterium]
MTRPVRRILIDCSRTPLDERPTGIPRVVRQYLAYAPAAAARAGVDLVAVDYVREGIFARYRGPGAPPAPPAPRRRRDLRLIPLKLLIELLRYVGPVLQNSLNLLAALLPIKPVRKVLHRFSNSVGKFVPKLKRLFGMGSPVAEPVTFGPGDVLFVPGCWFNMEISAYEAVRATGAEVVVLVHDVMPITLPQLHEYPWRFEFKQRFARLLPCLGHVYGISHQTLADVTAFAAAQGARVTAAVAYNGFTPPAIAADASALTPEVRRMLHRAPYVMVGTVEPKKGHADVVAAFEQLWAQGYDRPLLIVGRRGWHIEEAAERIFASPWRDTHLFWETEADDAGLEACYRAACGFISASHQEGFGLPGLEAAARGLPVVLRDLPVFREVMGGAARYFRTPEDLAALLLQLDAPGALAQARAAIEGLTWYPWDVVVEAVVRDLVRPPSERHSGLSLLAEADRRPVGACPPAALQMHAVV